LAFGKRLSGVLHQAPIIIERTGIMPIFTKAELSNALHELGQLCVEAGKVIDIALYGGSCLILVSNFRFSSEDVDAVALEDQAFVDQAAREIATRHGWPTDWLNDGVRTYLSPAVDSHDAHELFATYPEESSPGLRVYVPTPEYMLAMKLMALRIAPTAGKDLDDIINLLQIVGIESKAQIVDFAARFYPEARMSGKLRLALDDLWNSYRTKLMSAAHEPPEYLGRSRRPPQR
jgi:hypothetical protein